MPDDDDLTYIIEKVPKTILKGISQSLLRYDYQYQWLLA